MEILSSHRAVDGALILKLSIDDEPRPYIYRADDPYRMAGLDDLVSELDVGTLPVETLPPPVEKDYAEAIQAHVDAAAISRRYDSGNSLATYVSSSNPDWAAEAQAFVAWRDAVWAYAYVELDKVLAGEREQPSVEAFVGELPELMWPEPQAA